MFEKQVRVLFEGKDKLSKFVYENETEVSNEEIINQVVGSYPVGHVKNVFVVEK